MENFKYLWRTLDQTDDYWPALWRNIMCARLVWGRLGTLIRREGADPRVAEMFYRAVVQAILLYGLEKWVILAAMENKVERTDTVFLRNITEKQERWILDRTWETTRAEVVQEAEGTKSVMNYIGRSQATVAQWLELRPILEVCKGEEG